MKIEPRDVDVRGLVENYRDDGEGGVVGYSGMLDIRPPYQREFIYKDKQRDAVVNTIQKDFPLNVMYWADRGDGTFEVIDGQQRTISIAQYVAGDFSYDGLYFHNLPKDRRDQILDYRLMIYVCDGTDSEKLDWFKTINIAGMKLTDQELRNAVFAGSWVSDAKRYFSRNSCAAYQIGKDYMIGKPIRQEYLETAIKWISKSHIDNYMGVHQRDADAKELWDYFKSVVDWVSVTFTVKRKKMKGVDWGSLYERYKDVNLDPVAIEKETKKLIRDEDVQSHSGIYPYILTREEKYLNLRSFSDEVKQKVYEKQNGRCAICGKEFEIKDMEGDHITPWKEGGETKEKNCQMLCRYDNRRKSSR